MKYDEYMMPYQSYLVGEKIDTNLRVKMSSFVNASNWDFIGRNKFLTKLVQGQSVLHIGCADHLEVIRRKMETGQYLHSLLVEACPRVVGLDSNVSGLDAMRDLGFDPSHLIEDSDFEKLEEAFVFALIPDVIEHVPDVNEFLLKMKKLNVERYVFSTPNGLSLGNRKLLNSESVNSDHVVVFSPYTITKSLVNAGYKVEKIYLVDQFSKRQPIAALLLKFFPLLREHLIVIASKQ